MLIFTIIFLLSILPSSLSAPHPSNSTPGLTYFNSSTPGSSTYAAVLASGEDIFIPSTEDIVPLKHPSTLPRSLARYTTGRTRARDLVTRCDTTPASAYYSDALAVIVRLSELGSSWCCQTSSAPSCTQMGSFMTAGVSMCGPQGNCVKCGIVAMAADEVVRACRRWSSAGERSGGRTWYDQRTDIAVNHVFKRL